MSIITSNLETEFCEWRLAGSNDQQDSKPAWPNGKALGW